MTAPRASLRRTSRPGALLGAALCLLLASRPAVAKDEGEDVPRWDAPRALASQIAEAWRAGDKGAPQDGAGVAADNRLDPWEVADEILALGETAAASEFVRAAKSPDQAALAAYVASKPAQRPQSEARSALWAALRALDEGTPSLVDVELRAAEAEKGTVLWVRRSLVRATAEAQRSAGSAAAALYETAAQDAAGLGWTAAAQTARYQEGRLAFGSLGDVARARDLFRESARLAATAKDVEAEAVAVSDWGSAAATLGDLRGACDLYQRALDLYRQARLPEGVTDMQTQFGVALYRLGQYARALDLEDAAWGTSEGIESLDERDLRRAWIHVWYAVIHQEIGGLEKADDHLRQAAALLDGLEGKIDPPRLSELAAYVLGNRAYVLLEAGQTAEAAEASREALRYFERARDTLGLLGAYANAARIRAASGDVGTVAQQSAAWQRLAEAQDPVVALAVEADLAEVYQVAGMPQMAELVHTDVLARASGLGLPFLAARQWVGLAVARAARGDDVGAAVAARMLLPSLGGVVGGLGDEEAGAARQRFADGFYAGVRAARRIGDVSSVCLLAEAGRAGALLEALGGRERLRDVVLAPEELDALLKARAVAHEAYTAYLTALASGTTGASGKADPSLARRAAYLAAQDAVAAQVARIQRQAKARVGLVYPAPDDLARLQGHVREGEALVLYVLPPEGQEGRAGAVVVEAHGARVVDLGPAREIAGLTQTLVEDAREGAAGADTKAVAGRLVDPLKLPPSVRTWIVSPDGDMAYLPWAALAPDDVTVALVPSGTVLGALREDARRVAPDRPVLGVGDPDYDVLPGGVDPKRLPYSTRRERLPKTADEVRAVAKVRLLGKEATERRLREETERLTREGGLRALHLAAHGVLNTERPLMSCIALTAEPGVDDGYLTVVEAMQLSLRADLVVLSACGTGRGNSVRGEGAFGLVRAFMVAGAPRVIASLWDVDDRVTLRLMKDFYERWDAGSPPAKALHDGQMELKRAGVPMKDWSAWVLWGLPD